MSAFKDTFEPHRVKHLSRLMRKLTMWFPNRSDANRAIQAQKMARGWKLDLESREIAVVRSWL